MQPAILLDTGPLVAAIDRRDAFHAWVTTAFKQLQQPVLTCEAVITEACFLLQRLQGGHEAIFGLIEAGVIQIPFDLEQEAVPVQALLRQYQSVPMSLADACLVRMAELYVDSSVLTLDSDFMIYRKHRNQAVLVMMPDERKA
jgi:uncharacterized protein